MAKVQPYDVLEPTTMKLVFKFLNNILPNKKPAIIAGFFYCLKIGIRLFSSYFAYQRDVSCKTYADF